MIHLDTSSLIDALSGPGASAAKLREFIARGERLAISAIVLYEWRRGPRLPQQLQAQEALFPSEAAVPFGTREAMIAASVFSRLRRARGRPVDVAIAACAVAHGAMLWTLNPADFRDVPELELV
jgi:predicted nucleic acid-binding protein